jgi:hypothetical protein
LTTQSNVNTIAAETWKDVPGYEGRYQVSDQGRVRGPSGRVMRGGTAPNGYAHVTLRSSHHKVTAPIHKLVASAFLEQPSCGRNHINHRDGVKKNNAATNLEYVSNQENHAHASRLGLKPKGEKNGNSRLTEKEVARIKRLVGKVSDAYLARTFSVCRKTIANIRTERTWRHA